jgi:hypothetical protein
MILQNFFKDRGSCFGKGRMLCHVVLFSKIEAAVFCKGRMLWRVVLVNKVV